MRFCIHRGSAQIGGSCVELDAQGYTILLDLGLPLDAESVNADLLPNVSGLQARDSSLLGIVLSHGHRDHWGLIPKASSVPLYMGKATERIMRAAAQFVPDSFAPQAAGHLSHGTQLSIGPFQVTPFLVDHSAFDAYALLVEAAGKRVLYSGDFRAHGRKGALVEQLIRQPPPNMAVLIMEGSSLGRLGVDRQFPSERDLEEQFLKVFKSTSGLLLWSSHLRGLPS